MVVKVVGIAGITGKFARCILGNLLKQDSTVRIRGYCRDPTRLPNSLLSSHRLQIIKGEAVDREALRTFVNGCDVVICCYLGDNSLMVDGQRALVDACEAERVPRYVASDYTIGFMTLEYGQLPAKDPMKHIHEYLKSKASVSGVHVPYFGIFDPSTKTLSFWGTGNEAWEMTCYANAAEFVAAVALDESAVGFQRFLGDRKSIRQIAGTFEEVYGESVTLKCLGTLEELYDHMHHVRSEDLSNIFAHLAMFYQYFCNIGQTYIADDMNSSQTLNIKPVTLRDFLNQHSVQNLANAASTAASTISPDLQ
ncbi:NAD(P)-binding protein [Aspergillus spinulosporus]